ncbi:hypothetical protein EMN47_18140 [Prolixibacteraceae bacterium JC049]|nr:hypothetical protein [Prolixibacteraceae bacterium JC049]
MRKLHLTSIFFAIAVLLASIFGNEAKAADLTGKSNTWLGEYKISEATQPIVVKGKELKTYQLEYANGEATILVAVDPQKRCKNYIVRSKRFEAQYTCSKKGLGVKSLAYKYSSIAPEQNDALLDGQQFKVQQKLTLTSKTEQEAVQLIACYFPRLIKQQYRPYIAQK